MRKCVCILLLLCCVFPIAVEAASSSSENYAIVGADLNSGGSATMSSQNYQSSTTVGQSSPAGAAGSTNYQAQIGVQYIYAAQGTVVVPSYNYLLWTK